jgi:serine protease Do
MDFIEQPRRFKFLPYLFGGLLGVSLGLIIVSGVFFFKASRGNEAGRETQPAASYTEASSGPVSTNSIYTSRRNAIVAATQKAAPAVVSISSRYTKVVQRYPFRSSIAREWLEQFFGMPETYRRQYSSLGSGVIIHEDGYVLTNEHVVHNADVIEVTLSNGETHEGHLVGSAPEYDVALVKIDGGDYPKVALGDSDSLMVGEWAIAIGSPFGQLLHDTQPTVTVGVISALHRDVKSGGNDERVFKDMIQTDAAINPGNSGGPLLDSNGDLIGINTFIFSSSGGSLGMGFAIPINRGKWVLDEIQKYGRVRKVWVGITVREITPELATALDLDAREGLLIREIQLGSPADKAGLKPGDLITSVNGVNVRTTRDANRTIFGLKVGDRLAFQVLRNGDADEYTLVLEERRNEI